MSRAKKIADMAIFITIGVVLNIVSFPLYGNLGQMSFVYAFSYIVGILFGPWIGFGIASLADLIPALLLPQGPWMPLITLSVGMMALIMGLAFKLPKLNFLLKMVIGVFSAYLLCTSVLTPLGEVPLFYIWPYTFAKTIGASLGIKSPFLQISLAKMIQQPFWILLNSGLTFGICYKLKDVIKQRYGKVLYKPT